MQQNVAFPQKKIKNLHRHPSRVATPSTSRPLKWNPGYAPVHHSNVFTPNIGTDTLMVSLSSGTSNTCSWSIFNQHIMIHQNWAFINFTYLLTYTRNGRYEFSSIICWAICITETSYFSVYSFNSLVSFDFCFIVGPSEQYVWSTTGVVK